MMNEEHHIRVQELRANVAMMSGYEEYEVEADPSAATAAQGTGPRKAKFLMPRIPEADLAELLPFDQLCETSQLSGSTWMGR